MGAFEKYKPPISEAEELIKKEIKPKKNKFTFNPGLPNRSNFNVGFSDEQGKMRFEAKDPKAQLSNAEDSFKKNDRQKAWMQISAVKEEDRIKRREELMQGSDDDKKLAEDMYINDEWIDEEEKRWHGKEKNEE